MAPSQAKNNKPVLDLSGLTSRSRVLAAVVVGLGVFAVLFAVQSRSAPSASVIVALDEAQVNWPYHDSVRQSATGAIESSDDALASAAAAAAPGTVDELTTSMRDGQSYFEVSATGSDGQAASAAVDAAVAWAVAANLDHRSAPLIAEQDRLNTQITEMTRAYDPADLQSGDPLTQSRAEETASLIAQFERRLIVIDEELAGLRPQFSPIQPAAPDSNPLRPLLSGIGAFFASIAAFVLSEPTGAQPEPATARG